MMKIGKSTKDQGTMRKDGEPNKKPTRRKLNRITQLTASEREEIKSALEQYHAETKGKLTSRIVGELVERVSDGRIKFGTVTSLKLLRQLLPTYEITRNTVELAPGEKERRFKNWLGSKARPSNQDRNEMRPN